MKTALIIVITSIIIHLIGGIVAMFALHKRYDKKDLAFSISIGEYALALVSGWVGVGVVAFLNMTDRIDYWGE